MANLPTAKTLTQSLLKEYVLYDPVTGLFYNRKTGGGRSLKVGRVLGSKHVKGHLIIMVAGRNYRAHRLAWLWMTGEWPKDTVDHINRKKDDNRWCNLRAATNAENCRNVGANKRNTSGHVGVYWYKRKKRWNAQIRFDRKLIHLGYFKTKEAAIAARLAAEQQYFGQFAPSLAA